MSDCSSVSALHASFEAGHGEARRSEAKPDSDRETVREPYRQDLSTVRTSQTVVVDTQSDGSGRVSRRGNLPQNVVFGTGATSPSASESLTAPPAGQPKKCRAPIWPATAGIWRGPGDSGQAGPVPRRKSLEILELFELRGRPHVFVEEVLRRQLVGAIDGSRCDVRVER